MPRKLTAPKVHYEALAPESTANLDAIYDFLFEKILEEHKKSRL
jgi:hypothetical protein